MRSVSLLIVIIFLSTGCATIFNGSKQDVKITTNPSGAKVYVDNVLVGKTPITKPIKRRSKNEEVVIKLEGYEPYKLNLEREFNPTTLFNLLLGLGGIIGFGVDAASGAIYKLSPEQIRSDLKERETEGIGGIDNNNSLIYVKLIKNKHNRGLKKLGTMDKN